MRLALQLKLWEDVKKKLRKRASKLADRAVKAKTDEKFEKLQNKSENLFQKARIIRNTKK